MPTVRFAAINGAYWVGFCFLMSFSSVFLLDRGLSNSQIGLVLAGSGLASAVLQPLVAGWAGASLRGLRGWIAGLSAAIAVVVLPLFGASSPLRDALTLGVVLALLHTVIPLISALGMETARSGVPVDFGSARATGSFSYAVASLAIGALIAATSTRVIPPLAMVAQGLVIVAALTFVFARVGSGRADPSSRPEDGATSVEPGVSYLPRSQFVIVLLGATGCFIGHMFINTYGFQIVAHHGGDSSDLGLTLLIAAGVETLTMVFFRKIVARWRPDTLLRVGAIAFTIKAIATWLAPSLGAVVATMFLQVVAYALFLPASVYYVDRYLAPLQRVRGQAWMTLTATIGTVVAGLVGGTLMDLMGVPVMLALGSVTSALGAVAIIWGTRAFHPAAR